MLWDGRPHRFESLKGSRARIQESTTALLREVNVAELRGLPSLPLAQLDERLDRQRTTEIPDWAAAKIREPIIRDAMSGDGNATVRATGAAQALGVSIRTIQRLVARYKASAQTTSLVPLLPGPRKVHRRLGAERERMIDEAIEKRYLVRPRTPMEEAYREVIRRCKQKNLRNRFYWWGDWSRSS